jgi:hypothetical protein
VAVVIVAFDVAVVVDVAAPMVPTRLPIHSEKYTDGLALTLRDAPKFLQKSCRSSSEAIAP